MTTRTIIPKLSSTNRTIMSSINAAFAIAFAIITTIITTITITFMTMTTQNNINNISAFITYSTNVITKSHREKYYKKTTIYTTTYTETFFYFSFDFFITIWTIYCLGYTVWNVIGVIDGKFWFFTILICEFWLTIIGWYCGWKI